MSAKKQARKEYGRYIDGNTVRKIEERPLRSNSKQKKREQIKNQNIRRAKANQKTMGFSSFVLMFLATAFSCFLCIRYLRAETSMEASIKKITAMEKQLEVLKNENDAKESNINANIDLDEIFSTATGRLGMVYANKSQVIKYDKTESEYVRQYEDIPSR